MTRSNIAEYDDIVAPWTQGTSASDIRSALLSTAFLQGVEVPVDTVVHLNMTRFSDESLDPPRETPNDWKIFRIGGKPLHIPPFIPTRTEIEIARHLAANNTDSSQGPAGLMIDLLMERITSPLIVGELQWLCAILFPLTDQVIDLIGPDAVASQILQAGQTVTSGHADILKASGLAVQATSGLRLAWMHIAIAAPHLLRSTPKLTIVQ